jgi:hypothetical protein
VAVAVVQDLAHQGPDKKVVQVVVVWLLIQGVEQPLVVSRKTPVKVFTEHQDLSILPIKIEAVVVQVVVQVAMLWSPLPMYQV